MKEEFVKHIIDFVEKPHPAMSGMPVCPFARKARLEGRIRFEVKELTRDILSLVNSFSAFDHDILIIIHPSKDGVTKEEVEELTLWINQNVDADVMAFGGHPEHDFCVSGLYTRREPYPNVQIVSMTKVNGVMGKLKRTKYYTNWSLENIKNVASD